MSDRTELRDLRASSGGEPVAVRALEWSGVLGGSQHTGRSGLFSYNVRHNGDEPDEWSWSLVGTGRRHYVASEERAKAAAQADYEQRIRAALVPSPPPSAAPPSDGVADNTALIEHGAKALEKLSELKGPTGAAAYIAGWIGNARLALAAKGASNG